MIPVSITLLVCGGRDFQDRELMTLLLSQIHAWRPIHRLVHEAAPGADTEANHWAITHGIPTDPYPANWTVHGNRAGPIRNARILRLGKPDLVLALPGGRGTRDMIRRARETGLKVLTTPA